MPQPDPVLAEIVAQLQAQLAEKDQLQTIPSRVCEKENVTARRIALQHVADLAPQAIEVG